MRRRAVLALIAGAAVPALAWHSGTGAQSFRWQHDHPRFGGISALHLWPDGARYLALTDRGWFIEGHLARGTNGAIVAAHVTRMDALKGPEGRALKPRETDSEGLAVARDGTVFVSFEGPGGGRVWRYARIDGPAADLPRPEAFRKMALNGSLEALAIDARGRLFTLPEEASDGQFPVLRYDGAWRKVGAVPQRGGFLPVSADFGPSGQFFLLERRFVFPLGFASRLSVIAPGAWQEPRTLWQSSLGQFDNLEGLSLTRANGQLRATMVSDDNFLRLQRTELVEVHLQDL